MTRDEAEQELRRACAKWKALGDVLGTTFTTEVVWGGLRKSLAPHLEWYLDFLVGCSGCPGALHRRMCVEADSQMSPSQMRWRLYEAIRFTRAQNAPECLMRTNLNGPQLEQQEALVQYYLNFDF